MKPASAFSETTIQRVAADRSVESFHDLLAVEEPLEIRVGYFADGKQTHKAISITMRTPGDDAELAAGFLFTEGIISSPGQIDQIRHCGLKIGKGSGTIARAESLNSNTIRVDLNRGVELDVGRLQRHFYTSSSCGVCGKSSIEALHTGAKKIDDVGDLKIESALINRLPDVLRASQDTFNQTGGLHASALFDIEGKLEIVREDVGRHNALDKVIGAKFLSAATPLSNKILLVSGRASFELVQKALMAGIPILAAVGAPSSLAVELAAEFGMTLVGFLRDGRFNIYSGAARII
ncbi:MAG TPA: formate dehydrogenase accessory sulfurtransferase FdhD [Pyrinomonadaceae bacterium]|nr:formate dehydrogenase accessory sulfurtransferase FdhD [Pyrinomonadaceae bacterium]